MTKRTATAITAAAGLLMFSSCGRRNTGPAVPEPDAGTGSAGIVVSGGRGAEAEADSALAVADAVASLHETEREWRASDPAAAAAFGQMQEAQTAYLQAVRPFGSYAAAAREREAAAQALIAAREQPDDAAREAAEQDLIRADEALEAAAARLRLGNPRIRKAYEDWLDARTVYTALRANEETISTAAAAVKERAAGVTDGDKQNDRAKEN